MMNEANINLRLREALEAATIESRPSISKFDDSWEYSLYECIKLHLTWPRPLVIDAVCFLQSFRPYFHLEGTIYVEGGGESGRIGFKSPTTVTTREIQELLDVSEADARRLLGAASGLLDKTLRDTRQLQEDYRDDEEGLSSPWSVYEREAAWYRRVPFPLHLFCEISPTPESRGHHKYKVIIKQERIPPGGRDGDKMFLLPSPRRTLQETAAYVESLLLEMEESGEDLPTYCQRYMEEESRRWEGGQKEIVSLKRREET